MQRVLRLLMALACSVLAAAPNAPAADKTSEQTPRSTAKSAGVCLTRCRVKFLERVTLAADRPGTLGLLSVKEGDVVKAGQRVAGLKDKAATAALEVARQQAINDVEVRYARKAADVTKAEYAIALDTNRRVKRAVAATEVQRLKLAYERGLLQIEQAEQNLAISRLRRDAAEAELEAHQIVAPLDGVVRRVFKRVGEAVRQGDSVLELVVSDRVRVEGMVASNECRQLRVGDTVKVEVSDPHVASDGGRVTAQGRITFIDLEVQPVTGKVAVWAEVKNPGGLFTPGLMANMTMLHSRLPANAVASDGQTGKPIAKQAP